MARIATHYTTDTHAGKVTTQSLAACNYSRPKPTWRMTTDKAAVTCDRCLHIIEQRAARAAR